MWIQDNLWVEFSFSDHVWTLTVSFFAFFCGVLDYLASCVNWSPLIGLYSICSYFLLFWFGAVNIPVRDYQFNITKTALFANTLVALPTGLGKTLIAAVVMYNYFRWFPDGNKNLCNYKCYSFQPFTSR